jgi:hypothetical protein
MRCFINKVKNDLENAPSSRGNQVQQQATSGSIQCLCTTELCHMGHGTYPRATRLQDGSILGTHTAFQNGENVIVTTKSTDEGLSWSPFGEVPSFSISQLMHHFQHLTPLIERVD